MARNRIIDTDIYFDSDLVDLLGARGLHIYIRLWGLADDWGGYKPHPQNVAMFMGALHVKPEEVSEIFDKLIEEKKILVYDVAKIKYHWLVNFRKHQNLKSAAMPTVPLPPWIDYKKGKYPSGKAYAKYKVITEKLPGSFPDTTSSVPVIEKRKEKKRKETLYFDPKEPDQRTDGEMKKGKFYITKKGHKLEGKKLEWFNLFWDDFDYKSNKAEAADAWLNIKPSIDLDVDLFNEIRTAAKLEAKNRPALRAKGLTPKMAPGWLASRRWEDEPDNPAQQEKQAVRKCKVCGKPEGECGVMLSSGVCMSCNDKYNKEYAPGYTETVEVADRNVMVLANDVLKGMEDL